MRAHTTVLAWALTLGLAAHTAPIDGQQPLFRGGTSLVDLYVTVTDEEGRLVTDLEESDFLIYEDGQPQSIVLFEPGLRRISTDGCHMPGARDQKSWDAGLGGTKRDGCGTNPCGCCGSCVAPPRARPPPRRIARFRSLRHKLAAWLDGTPQTGASVTDGPRRGSPASPFPWSGCGPHRVGQSSCRVARMRPRVGIPLIPEDPGRSRDQNF